MMRKVTPDAVTTTVAGQVGVQQMRYHVDALESQFLCRSCFNDK